jgi:hypothetical protein
MTSPPMKPPEPPYYYHNQNQWSQHPYQHHNYQINHLDHHNFINKADIKYNSKIFSFYNKLQNFGYHYGIYLLPLQELRYNQSLCPTQVNGYHFTDNDYHCMAATLL